MIASIVNDGMTEKCSQILLGLTGELTVIRYQTSKQIHILFERLQCKLIIN